MRSNVELITLFYPPWQLRTRAEDREPFALWPRDSRNCREYLRCGRAILETAAAVHDGGMAGTAPLFIGFRGHDRNSPKANLRIVSPGIPFFGVRRPSCPTGSPTHFTARGAAESSSLECGGKRPEGQPDALPWALRAQNKAVSCHRTPNARSAGLVRFRNS